MPSSSISPLSAMRTPKTASQLKSIHIGPGMGSKEKGALFTRARHVPRASGKNLIVPPYLSPNDVRKLLSIKLPHAITALNIRHFEGKYYWQDFMGRAFETTSKRKILLPFEQTVNLFKSYGFNPIKCDVEPEWFVPNSPDFKYSDKIIPLNESMYSKINMNILTDVDQLRQEWVKFLSKYHSIDPSEKFHESFKNSNFVENAHKTDPFSVKRFSQSLSRHLPIPVVAVVGHINHGKTSIIDYIYNNNLVENEPGKITQYSKSYTLDITDYSKIAMEKLSGIKESIDQTSEILSEFEEFFQSDKIKLNKFTKLSFNPDALTFIDTPGHSAFDLLRGQAVHCADVVTVVVSAEKGTRAQTMEAVIFADKFKVPIVFAINKLDLPLSNFYLIKSEIIAECSRLFANGYTSLDYTPFAHLSVGVSAKTGIGMTNLIDQIQSTLFHWNNWQNDKLNYTIPTTMSLSINKPTKLPINHLIPKTTTPGVARKYQKEVRRSPVTLRASEVPMGIAIVTDVYKEGPHDKPVITAVIKYGSFTKDIHLVMGTLYGYIRNIKTNGSYLNNLTKAESSIYGPGMSITFTGVNQANDLDYPFATIGEVMPDDLIFAFDISDRAGRLYSQRRYLEKMLRCQTKGPQIPVYWQADSYVENTRNFAMSMDDSVRTKFTKEFKMDTHEPSINSGDENTPKWSVGGHRILSNEEILSKDDDLSNIQDPIDEWSHSVGKTPKPTDQSIITSDNIDMLNYTFHPPTDEFLELKDKLQDHPTKMPNYFDYRSMKQANLERNRKDLIDRRIRDRKRYDEIVEDLNMFEKNPSISSRKNQSSPIHVPSDDLVDEVIRKYDGGRKHKKDSHREKVKKTGREELYVDPKFPEEGDFDQQVKSSVNNITDDSTISREEYIEYLKESGQEEILNSHENNRELPPSFDPLLFKSTPLSKDDFEENFRKNTINPIDELSDPSYFAMIRSNQNLKLHARRDQLRRGEFDEQLKNSTIEGKAHLEIYQKFFGEEEGEKQMKMEELKDEYRKLRPKIQFENQMDFEHAQFNSGPLPKAYRVMPYVIRTDSVNMYNSIITEFERLEEKYRVKLPIVYGGLGELSRDDVHHAEVERSYAICPILSLNVHVSDEVRDLCFKEDIGLKEFKVVTDLTRFVETRILVAERKRTRVLTSGEE